VVNEAPPAAPLDLAEVGHWIGSELDDASGESVGRVTGIYADAESGSPVWLVLAVEGGRRRFPFGRRGAKAVIVPLRECAAMPGRTWTAQGRHVIHGAPSVDPTRSLLREHELTICLHYRIGEQVGRHAEVAARAAGSITARPA
jgi:PRC-barrel domain